MTNKLQKFIAEIEAKTDRGELEEALLEMLKQKQEALGENPTEEAVDEAVRQAIKEHLLYALRRKAMNHDDDEDEEEEDLLSEENEEETFERLEDEIYLVRSVFQNMDLHFRDYYHQKDVYAFQLGIREGSKHLKMKVYLEAAPRVCRIDAIYPFTADREFTYPLAEKLLEENYPRRFGALEYDARDGELAYRYSFPITHGLHEDDFEMVFLMTLKSAMTSFDIVKQYASGRFRQEVRQQISRNVHILLNELDL